MRHELLPLTTIAHAYAYDLTKPADAATYAALCEQLKGWPHQMHSLGDHHKVGVSIDGQTIELETAHLFENQWNTAPIAGVSEKGLRVFDWAEEALFNRGQELTHLKYGYWLEQTPAMREIRRNTVACGYCGKQEPAVKGSVFCGQCLDSPYLKAAELHLLRMMPIDQNGVRHSRPELSDAERAHLLPLYTAAQIHGTTERGKARIAKQRRDLLADRDHKVQSAKTKYDGMIWLLDHGLSIENVIYYDHTDRFSFGWRQPVDAEIVSAILDVISEFGYQYEIKCADGRKLEGNIG